MFEQRHTFCDQIVHPQRIQELKRRSNARAARSRTGWLQEASMAKAYVHGGPMSTSPKKALLSPAPVPPIAPWRACGRFVHCGMSEAGGRREASDTRPGQRIARTPGRACTSTRVITPPHNPTSRPGAQGRARVRMLSGGPSEQLSGHDPLAFPSRAVDAPTALLEELLHQGRTDEPDNMPVSLGGAHFWVHPRDARSSTSASVAAGCEELTENSKWGMRTIPIHSLIHYPCFEMCGCYAGTGSSFIMKRPVPMLTTLHNG